MGLALDSMFGDDKGENPQLSGVQVTDDLRRVLHLPQRDAVAAADRIVVQLTRGLKLPQGTMSFFPLQALALYEAAYLGGLLGPMPVGDGKTLVSYLLPVVMQAKRPLLILPGAMLKRGKGGRLSKTEREFTELAKHWQGHPYYRMLSYEMISRHPGLLELLDPDLIVADECDALKNLRAACTIRVRRFLRERAKAGRRVPFCGLSGTITNRSFFDWYHLQQWALPPELQPLPYSYKVLEAWCQALDEKVNARRPLGELWRLHHPTVPVATIEDIRMAFGKLFRGTPGIVGGDGDNVKAELRINCKSLNVPSIDSAVSDMRRTWCTPGGEEFSEASDLWRHAREMGNGFYYVWDPAPPAWWMDPRREFHQFVRQTLHGSRSLETMAQVKEAHFAHPAVVNWLAVKDLFEPNSVPVWFDDTVLQYALDWAASTPKGVVWVEHRAVGHALEARGLPYFGQGGLRSNGDSILDHKGPAAVSAGACYRGYNLQKNWHKNLVLNCVPKGDRTEQLLGRTHRNGQLEDTVHAEWLFCVDEQRAGFEQMRRDALYIQQSKSQKQKLCYAQYTGEAA